MHAAIEIKKRNRRSDETLKARAAVMKTLEYRELRRRKRKESKEERAATMKTLESTRFLGESQLVRFKQ